MAQEKYDVFISYSRKDYVDENKNVIPDNVVSIIKDRLTAEGISYWFDEEGIYSGQNFVEKIVTNIEASRMFLFLSTANANASPWTCKEIASADEFKKFIIPVRIDRTPYNRKVMFRIADLNYLEYYVNPEKALNDLVDGIRAHLNMLQLEEKRKQEEAEKKREEERKKREEELKKKEEEEQMRLAERIRQEEERKRKEEEEQLKKSKEEERRRMEQEKIIRDIILTSTKLNNEESKLELDRSNLLISLEQVTDPEQKKELKALIIGKNLLRKQYEEQKEELQEKHKENQALKRHNDFLAREVKAHAGKKESRLKMKILLIILIFIELLAKGILSIAFFFWGTSALSSYDKEIDDPSAIEIPTPSDTITKYSSKTEESAPILTE